MAVKDFDQILRDIDEKKKKILKEKFDTRVKPVMDIFKKHLDKISDEEIEYVASYLQEIVDKKIEERKKESKKSRAKILEETAPQTENQEQN